MGLMQVSILGIGSFLQVHGYSQSRQTRVGDLLAAPRKPTGLWAFGEVKLLMTVLSDGSYSMFSFLLALAVDHMNHSLRGNDSGMLSGTSSPPSSLALLVLSQK